MLCKRAVLLGFLSWLIPFAIGFLVFPLKRNNAPLFESIMALVVALTAGLLLRWYFRDRSVVLGEAIVVGALWVIINLACDYPMFSHGPMKMTALQYYSEIGAAYLLIPVVAFGGALLARTQQRRA